MRILILPGAIAVLVLGALALILRGTPTETLVIGGVLVLVGLPCLVAARRQLGSSFTVGPQAKALVTRGLYARIPHPMYAFLDLAALGVVIVSRQAWLLVAWGALVTAQCWQARREARVLAAAFGDAYREYRRRTWW